MTCAMLRASLRQGANVENLAEARTNALLIEDNASDRLEIKLQLEVMGFSVFDVSSTAEAREIFPIRDYSLVLIHLGHAPLESLEICRQIRALSTVPIIMITKRGEVVDEELALGAGADDYVTKPYSSRELIARIKAVMRRRIVDDALEGENGVHLVGGIKLDVGKHQVTINGQIVSLPLKEFELLEFLMRNAGRVLTRSQLIDRVWGGDYYGDTKTLDVHIKRLRAKIEADPANPVLIQTIRGLGYKLENA